MSEQPTRVVFLDRSTIAPWGRLRPPSFRHVWTDHDATAPHDVVARAKGARIVVTNKVRIFREDMEALPALRMIAVAATGTDIVDLDAARDLDIVVANVADYAGETVPEHVFALILALSRNLGGYTAAVAAGDWARSGQFCFFPHPISDLAGATLGIVGAGRLGRSVGRLGEAFGMRVLFSARKGADPEPGHRRLDELLESADVLTLHCPLTPETRGLIDREALSRMARRPVLINTARGALVDEAAIAAALREGRLSGFGTDVASSEPIGPDHPFQSLLGRPDVIVTPHIAWAGSVGMQKLCDRLIDNIEAFQAGVLKGIAV